MAGHVRPRSISRLLLTRFRSYADAVIETAGGPVVLAGPNGIGKTNLLEAISLLSPGRGLRSAPHRQIQQHEFAPAPHAAQQSGWAVAARLQTEVGAVDIGTGTAATGSERRQIRISGDTATTGALLGLLTVLWLTPAQDRLFSDGSSERRRFYDRLVLALYPDHAGHVARYEAASRERLRLLTGGPADSGWLDALETRLAEQAVAVAAARLDHLGHLQQLLADLPESPFPRARVWIEGELEAQLASGRSALDVEEEARVRLRAQRAADAASGRAGFGAHRMDLMVDHVPKAMPAGLCSTGEQKALLIGLMLAQTQLVAARSGRMPIILLDEVAAHLDVERRSALFDLLCRLGVQAWMTGTDLSLFKALSGRAQAFTIAGSQTAPIDL